MNVTVLADPVKSISDVKEYRHIQLNNHLRALLISDSTVPQSSEDDDDVSGSSCDDSDEDCSDVTDDEDNDGEGIGRRQAAAALCVNVGSFSDPDHIPGLAHFLEHMVFMGSSKYPDENYFDAFIRRHGGSDNAHTDCERTVFEFEINPSNFKQALDIWVQFFISPLMKVDSIEREVKAVDSEFQVAVVDDDCRREQLIGQLCKTGHPMQKFMWGNLETLQTLPSKNGIKVYDALGGFHADFYNAKEMFLVVQSNNDLDTLQDWVVEMFKDIPNHPKMLHQEFAANVPYPDKSFQLYEVVPVKDIKKLYLTWFLPPQHKHYKVKPLHYVSWLVGHEGKGSLLSLLKNKSLAFSLAAESDAGGLTETSLCSMFTIDISLTSTGCDNYSEVIDYVFQYLRLLQVTGPVKRIFSEIQQIEKNDFAYCEETSPLSNVEDLCENLHLFPAEDVLSGDHLLIDFDPEVIQLALDTLTPDKCIMFLYKSNRQDPTDYQTEPWFGTAYREVGVDRSWLNRWACELEVHPDLCIPVSNPYISDNFNIAPFDSLCNDVKEIKTAFPSCRLWFKQDSKFRLPKAFIWLHLVNSDALVSPENRAYLDLLINIFNHSIAEIVYDADAASLVHKVSSSCQGGIFVKVSGYNDKLHLLLDTILRAFESFTTTEDVVKEHKLQLTRNYYNAALSPRTLSKDIRLTILEKSRFLLPDKYNASQNLSHQGLLQFFTHFKSALRVDCLIQGNYTETDASQLFHNVVGVLKCSHLNDDSIAAPRVLKLPFDPQLVKAKSLNPDDDNSVITIYFQFGGGDIRTSIMFQLLALIMDEPCFDILRTKKQLGYNVYVQDHSTSGILGLSINVETQNSKFTVEEASKHMMEFIRSDFVGLLDVMSDSEFEAQVAGLVAIKKHDDNHLGEEVERNWDEIFTRDLQFHRLEDEINCLEDISLSDLKLFYQKVCIHNKNYLITQVRGNSPALNQGSSTLKLEMLSPEKETFLSEIMQIYDITAFTRSNYYYPVCHVLG